jgi:hypothetical protein
VLALVGRGGMGMVFRGWDPKLQRNVALKAVRMKEGRSESEREDLVAALRTEAVTIAKFSHPNIVAVYDVESAGDAAFIFTLIEHFGVHLAGAVRRIVGEMGRTDVLADPAEIDGLVQDAAFFLSNATALDGWPTEFRGLTTVAGVTAVTAG